MKLTSKELKRTARETLTGHYGVAMAAFSFTQLLILIANSPFNRFLQTNPSNFQRIVSFLASIIISLLSAILNAGILSIHLNLSRGKQVKLTDLFSFFSNHPDRFILAALTMLLLFLLPSLPAIVCTRVAFLLDSVSWYILMGFLWILTFFPLCILSLMYELVYLLLIENPQSDLRSIFRESRMLMQGHKKRKFYINISFLGMIALSILSLGIGLLWVVPYKNQTTVEFYRNLKNEI